MKKKLMLIFLFIIFLFLSKDVDAGLIGILTKGGKEAGEHIAVKSALKKGSLVPLRLGKKANKSLKLLKELPEVQRFKPYLKDNNFKAFFFAANGIWDDLINIYGKTAVRIKDRAKAIKYAVYGRFLLFVARPISRHPRVLPAEKIIELTELAKAKGIREVGKKLGKIRPPLPNEVLEDAYLRILVYNGKLSRKEAEEFFKNLRGVEGFRTTLRKVAGSESQSIGHLFELRIANEAKKRGFKVEGIGKKYNDGIKRGDTDLDISIIKGRIKYIIDYEKGGKKDYELIFTDGEGLSEETIKLLKELNKKGKIPNELNILKEVPKPPLRYQLHILQIECIILLKLYHQ